MKDAIWFYTIQNKFQLQDKNVEDFIQDISYKHSDLHSG
jgi:hypothetical protein